MNHRLAANLPRYAAIAKSGSGVERRTYGLLQGKRSRRLGSKRIPRRGLLSAMPRMWPVSPRCDARLSRPCQRVVRRRRADIAPTAPRVSRRRPASKLALRQRYRAVCAQRAGSRAVPVAVSDRRHLDREFGQLQMVLGVAGRSPRRHAQSGRLRPPCWGILLDARVNRAYALCRRNRGLASGYGDGLPVGIARRHSRADRWRQGLPDPRPARLGELTPAGVTP